MSNTILLTGGTGFIASHTATVLVNSGYEVILADNLVNSKADVISRLAQIMGFIPKFYEADVCDENALRPIFEENDIYGVIHFAALKAVGESIEKSELYYENNIGSIETLLSVMENFGVKRLIFSSSATVYGNPEYCPIDEGHSLTTTNPYGETKIACEEILRATYANTEDMDDGWKIALLRYFNPIGAHPSGLIGEDPNGIPNNIAPYIAKVAVGELNEVNIFGDDYNTPDGTCVRDYIHVMDLAEGNLKALERIDEFECRAVNLGTGNGYSVLEVISAFEKALGDNIKYKISNRREGDVEQCYADIKLSKKLMNWQPKYDLKQMAIDHLNWVKG